MDRIAKRGLISSVALASVGVAARYLTTEPVERVATYPTSRVAPYPTSRGGTTQTSETFRASNESSSAADSK
jgi:hypothetical protein